MKVNISEPAEREVTLRLTESEASGLLAVLNRLNRAPFEGAGEYLFRLRQNLAALELVANNKFTTELNGYGISIKSLPDAEW